MKHEESIRVRNVGGINDTGTIQLRPLTVFTGSNANTLMKIVTIMRELLKADTLYKQELKDYLSQYTADNAYIEYKIGDQVIEYKEKSIVYSNDQHKGNAKAVYLANTRNLLTYIKPGEYYNHLFLYKTLKEFANVVDESNFIELDYNNTSVEIVKNVRGISYNVVSKLEENKTTNIQFSSGDIQYTLPVIAIIKHNADEENASFYIEDIEAGMDCHNQARWIDEIVSKVGDKPLIFTTQSPYVLNYLSVLLCANYYDNAKEKYPVIEAEKFAIYDVNNKSVVDLLWHDEYNGRVMVNTIDSSSAIEDIYREFDNLGDCRE